MAMGTGSCRALRYCSPKDFGLLGAERTGAMRDNDLPDAVIEYTAPCKADPTTVFHCHNLAERDEFGGRCFSVEAAWV